MQTPIETLIAQQPRIKLSFYDRDDCLRDVRFVSGQLAQAPGFDRTMLIDGNGLAHASFDGGKIKIEAAQ